MIGLTAGKHIFIRLTKPVDETGFFLCAPGMGDNYRVKDPNTLDSRKC
jgi:hypothetical protein